LHDAREAVGLEPSQEDELSDSDSEEEHNNGFVSVDDDPAMQRDASPAFTRERRVSATGEDIEESPRESVRRLEAMLRREREGVEKFIWRCDALCQDVLITQCFMQAEPHVAGLFSQEWWVAEVSLDPLLSHVNLNSNSVAVKRLFHKVLRNLSYVYVSRLVAAATADKRPEWASCMAAGKRPQDYSVLILSDKLQADFLKLRAFAKDTARLVIISDGAEDARTEGEDALQSLKYTRADFGEDFSLCADVLFCLEKDNDQLVNKELSRLSARVSGVRYTYHDISQKLRGCVVDTVSLLHATSLLRGVSAADTKNMLGAVRSMLVGRQLSTPKSPPAAHRMRMYVWVECARGLAAVNSNGLDSDPYVVVQLREAQDESQRGGRTLQKRRSRTLNSTLNPDWYELLPGFSADASTRCESVEVQVHDSNLLSYNVLIGAVTIPRLSIEQRCMQRAAKEASEKQPQARRGSSPNDVQQKRQVVLASVPNVWGWYQEKIQLEKNKGTLSLTFIIAQDVDE